MENSVSPACTHDVRRADRSSPTVAMPGTRCGHAGRPHWPPALRRIFEPAGWVSTARPAPDATGPEVIRFLAGTMCPACVSFSNTVCGILRSSALARCTGGANACQCGHRMTAACVLAVVAADSPVADIGQSAANMHRVSQILAQRRRETSARAFGIVPNGYGKHSPSGCRKLRPSLDFPLDLGGGGYSLHWTSPPHAMVANLV